MGAIFMKIYVIMILKQLLGNSVFIMVASALMLSCSLVKKNRKHNFFNGTNFYNYPLNVSGRFFGDIQYYQPEECNGFISFSKAYKLHKNDLLVYGKTTEIPHYELFVFLKKNKHAEAFTTAKLVANDTLNNAVLYEKSNGMHSFFVALKSIGKHKSNSTILHDGKSIIEAMSFTILEENAPSYMDIFNNYKNEDNYLFVMNRLENAPINSDEKKDWIKFQLLTTILSFDTEYYRYKTLIKEFENKRTLYFNDLFTTKKEHLLSHNEYNNTATVLQKIAEMAKAHRVVMLNEMHWKPEHRVFATKLLKPLKENGYTHLAVEAIDKGQDSLLNSRKFPIKTSGYYLREPFFNNFIKEACALGFTIVDYDDFESSNRELSQAENLKRVFDKDTTAKVFVYAGIDHVLENEEDVNQKRMAALFKDLTGIDPLTIDQVEIVSNVPNELTLFASDAFKDVDKVTTTVDYFVVNNIVPSFSQFSELSTISINDALLEEVEGQEVLLNFYDREHYSKYRSRSIPVISRIKKVKNAKVDLEVPKGSFFLIIKSKENKEVMLKDISVN